MSSFIIRTASLHIFFGMCLYFHHTFGNIDTETILEDNENKTNIDANLDDENTAFF